MLARCERIVSISCMRKRIGKYEIRVQYVQVLSVMYSCRRHDSDFHYRVNRGKLPFGQLLVDDLSLNRKNSFIHL